MRVDFDHTEVRRGFVLRKTYYQVTVNSYFTEEEKELVRALGFEDETLMDFPSADAEITDPPRWYRFTVHRAMYGKPWTWLGATKGDAQEYEHRVMERFALLKEHLDDYRESGGPRSGSYQL